MRPGGLIKVKSVVYRSRGKPPANADPLCTLNVWCFAFTAVGDESVTHFLFLHHRQATLQVEVYP